MERQYNKNFSYLRAVDLPSLHLPRLNLQNIQEYNTKVVSPKQWRLATKAKGFDSASLLGTSQADTNLSENLDQLRKIRK